MRKQVFKRNQVIVACCQDLAALKNLKNRLTSAGISFNVRTESVIDYDPKTGYPRAFDMHWLEVEPSHASSASEIAQTKYTPTNRKLVCPKCLSASVELEGFVQWFLPVFVTRFLTGHPNLPGRKRKCFDCDYEWAPFNRPAM